MLHAIKIPVILSNSATVSDNYAELHPIPQTEFQFENPNFIYVKI